MEIKHINDMNVKELRALKKGADLLSKAIDELLENEEQCSEDFMHGVVLVIDTLNGTLEQFKEGIDFSKKEKKRRLINAEFINEEENK